MTEIKLEGMQSLMPSMERAKTLGLIKEPEEINIIEKNNILKTGIVIGGLLILISVVIIVQYEARKKIETSEA